MTKYTDIGVEKHGHVGLIEIRKPPLNFFDVSLINQIADALEEFDKDIEIRASVLAAQGKAFCAGADFSDPKRQEQEASAQKDPAANLPINHLYVQAVRIFRNKKPVVAAIHGAAIGGGLGLRMGEPYVKRISKAMKPHLFVDEHPPAIELASLVRELLSRVERGEREDLRREKLSQLRNSMNA